MATSLIDFERELLSEFFMDVNRFSAVHQRNGLNQDLQDFRIFRMATSLIDFERELLSEFFMDVNRFSAVHQRNCLNQDFQDFQDFQDGD